MLVTDLFDATQRIAQAQRIYVGALADLRRQRVSVGNAQTDAVGDLLAAATPAQLDTVSALPWLTCLRAQSSLQPSITERCRAVVSGDLCAASWQGAANHPHLMEPLTRLVVSGARIAIATRAIAMSCLTTASLVTRTAAHDLAPLLDDAVDEATIVMALRIDPMLVCARPISVVTALANCHHHTQCPLSLAAAGVHRTVSSARPRRAAA